VLLTHICASFRYITYYVHILQLVVYNLLFMPSCNHGSISLSFLEIGDTILSDCWPMGFASALGFSHRWAHSYSPEACMGHRRVPLLETEASLLEDSMCGTVCRVLCDRWLAMLWNDTVWTSKVLCPIWHKIGHFGDVLPSQSLGSVLKKTKSQQN